MVAPEVVEGISGAAAGMAATVVTYPLMTVSTLQATRAHKRETILPSAKKAATGTIADIAEVSKIPRTMSRHIELFAARMHPSCCQGSPLRVFCYRSSAS